MSLTSMILRFLAGVALALTLGVSMPSIAAAEPAGTTGVWQGALSGGAFTLKVWNTGDSANATIAFEALTETENLVYLGSKAGIDYYFRPLDRAAISVYGDGSSTLLSYFERGSVRTLTLTRR